MSYHAEYAIDGTVSTMTVTGDEVRGHCVAHGHLATINPDEYAFPAAHVERVARLHHIDQH